MDQMMGNHGNQQTSKTPASQTVQSRCATASAGSGANRLLEIQAAGGHAGRIEAPGLAKHWPLMVAVLLTTLTYFVYTAPL